MKVDKHTATLITFFLSACIHELVMWCIFKKLRGYLLVLQMCQLPVSWHPAALGPPFGGLLTEPTRLVACAARPNQMDEEAADARSMGRTGFI